jgi:type IV pilus assembly protein PilW
MSEKGFTLVEILVAMVVSLIVLGALVGNFIMQHNTYRQQAEVTEMQEYVRAGIEMMTRELLMAGYNPTGGAATGILSADLDSIQFAADLNEDGVIDTDEDITYTLDTVDRQLTRNGEPLAENIPPGGLEFIYYDENDIELSITPLSLADLDRVRKISIWLQGKTKSPSPGHVYIIRDLESYVVPRNLVLD